MLPEIIYRKASGEFGVPVGVAKILGYKNKKDHIEEITPENYKKLSDDLDINWIVAECILDGIYKKLQRELFRLKSSNPRLKTELSRYRRAYKNINGKSNQNRPKSSKVQSQG